MKAAVVPTLGAPLEVRDVPVPEPGPGQVLVRIETCGLCHTDIHAARGEWPVAQVVVTLSSGKSWTLSPTT